MINKKSLMRKLIEWDEVEALEKEIKARKERLENEMKGEMDRRGVTELEVGNRVVRWTPYVSQRFDSTGFRKAEPEMYAEYVKEVKGRRFSVT